MKTAHYGVLGDGAASLGSYASWQERAAFQYCLTLEHMDAAGIVMTQPESTDFDSVATSVNDFLSDFGTWLDALPGLDIGDDPATRGVPALPPVPWPALVSSVVSLVVSGVGGVPAILTTVAISTGLQIFYKFLEGKIFPDNDGSTAEIVRVLRKALLWDPGLLNLERSVFVAEKPEVSQIGGEKESLGQLLYRFLKSVDPATEEEIGFSDILKKGLMTETLTDTKEGLTTLLYRFLKSVDPATEEEIGFSDILKKGLMTETLTDTEEGLTTMVKKILAVSDPSNGEIVGSKVDGLSNLHITINNVREEEDHLFSIAGEKGE